LKLPRDSQILHLGEDKKRPFEKANIDNYSIPILTRKKFLNTGKLLYQNSALTAKDIPLILRSSILWVSACIIFRQKITLLKPQTLIEQNQSLP